MISIHEKNHFLGGEKSLPQKEIISHLQKQRNRPKQHLFGVIKFPYLLSLTIHFMIIPPENFYNKLLFMWFKFNTFKFCMAETFTHIFSIKNLPRYIKKEE